MASIVDVINTCLPISIPSSKQNSFQSRIQRPFSPQNHERIYVPRQIHQRMSSFYFFLSPPHRMQASNNIPSLSPLLTYNPQTKAPITPANPTLPNTFILPAPGTLFPPALLCTTTLFLTLRPSLLGVSSLALPLLSFPSSSPAAASSSSAAASSSLAFASSPSSPSVTLAAAPSSMAVSLAPAPSPSASPSPSLALAVSFPAAAASSAALAASIFLLVLFSCCMAV